MKVSTLKNLAKERGLRGYSRLKKPELIERVINPPPIEYMRIELRQLARERGLRGYSRLRKPKLIERVINPPPIEYTRTQLRQLARERGLRGYSRLRKPELIQKLIRPVEKILHREIDARMANVPFLTPTPYSPPQATPQGPPQATPASSNDVKDLIDYLDKATKRPKKKKISYRSVSELRRLLKPIKLRKEIDKIYKRTKTFEVKESNSALKKFAKVYTISGKLGFDARSFLDNARENMTKVLRDNRNTKVKLILKCYMVRYSTNEIKPADFHSNIEVNLDGADERELYDSMVERILEKIATFQDLGSEWGFHSIIKFELHTVSYKPLRGETYILLPKELAYKKAIINVQNKEDNKCFLWSVLRALNPDEKNPQRLDKNLMGKENTLNMEGIDYPVSLKDLDKFEKQNPSISITVLGYEEKKRLSA